MSWHVHQVILRLRSPMHIGWNKVGNLQRTRPYVTGRVLWGALTMRLTRDEFDGRGAANDSRDYRRIGEQVHQTLAFTYFYPALRSSGAFQVVWPWEGEVTFRRRFLSSYQGTALSYPHQSAAEGMLHEVEFLAPNTLDTGEPVFLMGYIFEREGGALDWKSSFKRLQVGGERGYGWGDVELVSVATPSDEQLFGGVLRFEGDRETPVVALSEGEYLLAHAMASTVQAAGVVEPLVGREWRSDNARRRHVGQHVAFTGVCFTPGSVVTTEALSLAVDKFGVWKGLDDTITA